MANTTDETFYETLDTFHTGMLVTHAAGGALRARPMVLAGVDRAEDRLYFFTDLETPKVDEIRHDELVSVTFQSTSAYLSISGTARILVDRPKVRSLWQDAFKVWFPQGPDHDSLALIELNGDSGEIWDTGGKATLRYLFEASKAFVRGESIDADALASTKVSLG